MSAKLQPRNESSGEATTLAHLGIRVAESVQKWLSEFEQKSPTIAEVLLGTTHQRLAPIPIAELDSLVKQIEARIAAYGCSNTRCFGDDFALSDVLLRLKDAQEQIAPYRPLLAKLK